MNIAIASDHRGIKRRHEIIDFLTKQGFTVKDFGTEQTDTNKVDHIDYAKKVAAHLKKNPNDKGILLCGTGVGMAISANRFSHIRAVNITSKYIAQESRQHTNVNVAVFGADTLSKRETLKYLTEFLKTENLNDERYNRRIKKLSKIGEK